jgi:hypothetical protein
MSRSLGALMGLLFVAASDCAFVQGPWGLASSLRRRAPIASVCALRSCANSAASAAAAG